ncbi:Hypothetical protein SRAE_1000022800 [Strongyloides ratti]|uniref:Uncharacterized protein n=1 Tax=Strongyloides ratti TaxID=34506 RepID=A0A090L1F8_STRRB|nr:Hypothetical protein SRAE_1000022800 [Strongyloides ratti]CEF61952.1 Hypothetical protein SRAE_1000022800 [Strongyloides ratti]
MSSSGISSQYFNWFKLFLPSFFVFFSLPIFLGNLGLCDDEKNSIGLAILKMKEVLQTIITFILSFRFLLTKYSYY